MVFTTAPIRTAIIGLSSSAATSWAAGAHLPNFLTATGRSKLEIVALCNSSVSAAESAIKFYKLSPSTKAYGSPDDLAQDPDVEFVICNTRVDKHYETILPSLKAGKHVYIEWPIAANAKQIEDLVQVARQQKKERGTIVAIGLQGRWAPPVVKLRQLVEQQVVGPLLSTEVQAYGGTIDREILPVGLKYFADRRVGGNPITIGVGHVLDLIQTTVGRVIPSSANPHFALQRPDVRIRDPQADNAIIETVRSDVPDLFTLSASVAQDKGSTATLSFFFRRGQPPFSSPSLTWTLNCVRGEIRLVSPSAIALQIGSDQDPPTIQIHRFNDANEVEDVPWDWSEVEKEVPLQARGVQTCLYAIADAIRSGNGEKGGQWTDIEDAARWAETLGGWLDGFEA